MIIIAKVTLPRGEVEYMLGRVDTIRTSLAPLCAATYMRPGKCAEE